MEEERQDESTPGEPPAPENDATAGEAPALDESSGAPVEGWRAALRIGLILAVALLVAWLGLWSARALPGLPPVRWTPPPDPFQAPDMPEEFPVLEGDAPLSSEKVVINGQTFDSYRFVSPLAPHRLVAAYARRLRAAGYDLLPGAPDGGFVGFAAEGQAMLGVRDPEGRFVGLVAFADDDAGGCEYLVTRDPGEPDARTGVEGEVAGNEPPGVPRPPASVREYCLERNAPGRSVLSLYWSDAARGTITALYRREMAKAGWEEPASAREVLVERPEETQVLFRRGGEQCMVQICPESPERPGCWVTLMYRRR